MGLLSVPLKTILPYHADLQNEAVPESYAVCNGQTLSSAQQDINPGSTYTLPDLRNVFLLGGDLTKAAGNAGDTSNTASGAPGPKGQGGAHQKSLIVAELAAHSHSGTISNAGAHTHAGSTVALGGAHGHTGATTSAGGHTHDGSSVSLAGVHNHPSSTISVGGQHSHSITDPGHTHVQATVVDGGDFYPNGNLSKPVAGYGAYHGGSVNTSSSVTGVSILTNGDHTHTFTIASDGNHTHTLTIASDGIHSHPVTINNGGDHTHTISVASDGDHTHSFTGGSAGSGAAWDTRPRYYGVIYIMKVRI